jgi:hypothetical protein
MPEQQSEPETRQVPVDDLKKWSAELRLFGQSARKCFRPDRDVAVESMNTAIMTAGMLRHDIEAYIGRDLVQRLKDEQRDDQEDDQLIALCKDFLARKQKTTDEKTKGESE